MIRREQKDRPDISAVDGMSSATMRLCPSDGVRSPHEQYSIYVISQKSNHQWGVFVHAFVVARSESEARGIHPDGRLGGWWSEDCEQITWVNPEAVTVEFVRPCSGVYHSPSVLTAHMSFRLPKQIKKQEKDEQT